MPRAPLPGFSQGALTYFLLPFVTRLACADAPKVERERERYIDAHLNRGGFFATEFRFDEGLRALEGALAIGRQADPLGLEEAAVRLDAAREAAVSGKKGPGLWPAKMKAWLGLQKAPENVE